MVTCNAGDMDFLIMPPPSREPVACGAVLQALLARLLHQGLLLDEMSPNRPRPRDTGSATWLGLCRPAGSLYVRRIDFKVYPARSAVLSSAFMTLRPSQALHTC